MRCTVIKYINEVQRYMQYIVICDIANDLGLKCIQQTLCRYILFERDYLFSASF